MSLNEFFKKLKAASATHSVLDQVEVSETGYLPVFCETPGAEFTFFLGQNALSFLKKHADLELREIENLLTPVIHQCRKHGFSHGEPIHFFLEMNEGKDLKQGRKMTVAKIEPPITLSGKKVTRSVLIFGPELKEDMAYVETAALLAYEFGGSKLTEKQKKQIQPSVLQAKRAKIRMDLSHELIHIFATDEYRKLMPILGLDLLELLTDSINLDLHYDEYKNSALLVQSAFCEGFGYLSNLVQKEPGWNPGIHLERMRKRSLEILKDCKKRARI